MREIGFVSKKSSDKQWNLRFSEIKIFDLIEIDDPNMVLSVGFMIESVDDIGAKDDLNVMSIIPSGHVELGEHASHLP